MTVNTEKHMVLDTENTTLHLGRQNLYISDEKNY